MVVLGFSYNTNGSNRFIEASGLRVAATQSPSYTIT
jgi:hypothetical protein